MSSQGIDRRTVLRAAAAAAVLAGVGSSAGCSTKQAGVASVAVAMSQVGRAAADPAAVPGGVAALTGFTGRMFGQMLAAAPKANVVFSPYSIFAALAMTRAGAAGATATAMDATLGIADGSALHAQANALALTLASRAGAHPDPGRPEATITWREANSMWGQAGTPWQAPFLDTLARSYGAGMRQVDFITDTEAARRAINGWTSEQTNALIPEIIPTGILDAMTRFVLVNALYLKAPWAEPFEESLTTQAPFTTASGKRVDVPLMRGLTPFRAARGPGWSAASLPYVGSDVALAVVLPDQGSEAAVQSLMTRSGLGGILTNLTLTRTALTAAVLMPRMKLRTEAALARALKALGMGVAFSDSADFSGMTTAERLQIAEVLHQAVVAIDEHGTEAAAATAVIGRATSAPLEPPLTIRLDRPFYLVIWDVPTRAPIFLGYVADPTA